MKRRKFLSHTAKATASMLSLLTYIPVGNALFILASPLAPMTHATERPITTRTPIRLFLCGDVMTGRGIDQVFPHPGNPQIYEPYVRDAREYVKLAEAVNGPIPRGVDFDYIWGDALEALKKMAPDLRIINLETAVTQSEGYWRGKGINYRMHPKNIPCLSAAKVDCCVLANNHTLDWGYPGLVETLRSLQGERIESVGAGSDLSEAESPSILDVAGKGRVILFAFGHYSSGVPAEWAATKKRAGINLLEDLSTATIRHIGKQVQTHKREGDIVVLSIHWGGNWGYQIPAEQRQFAHRLIDEAGVDVVYGHSSHHPKGIEVYQGRPIIYGCGDFINDYEGIGGYESYRDDLSLMYLVDIDPVSGGLTGLEMVPFQTKRFSLHRASEQDALWLKDMLHREGRPLNTRVDLSNRGTLTLQW